MGGDIVPCVARASLRAETSTRASRHKKVNLTPGPAHAREHAYELTLLNRCKCTQACKGKLMRDSDRVAGPEDPRSLRIENAGDLG